jgi:long-chain acyl-CoA synthetase
MNIPFTNWQEIVDLEQIKEFYREKIDEIQKGLSGFEKVKKFTLMPAEFAINSGEITPTLKVKRNVVLQKYVAIVEKMYHS